MSLSFDLGGKVSHQRLLNHERERETFFPSQSASSGRISSVFLVPTDWIGDIGYYAIRQIFRVGALALRTLLALASFLTFNPELIQKKWQLAGLTLFRLAIIAPIQFFLSTVGCLGHFSSAVLCWDRGRERCFEMLKAGYELDEYFDRLEYRIAEERDPVIDEPLLQQARDQADVDFLKRVVDWHMNSLIHAKDKTDFIDRVSSLFNLHEMMLLATYFLFQSAQPLIENDIPAFFPFQEVKELHDRYCALLEGDTEAIKIFNNNLQNAVLKWHRHNPKWNQATNSLAAHYLEPQSAQ